VLSSAGLAAQAGVRRRFAPHQLRHAHAVELAREGVPLNVAQRQFGHDNLGTTSIYVQGIDIEKIIATVHARRVPRAQAPRMVDSVDCSWSVDYGRHLHRSATRGREAGRCWS
jgi:integrase